MLALFDGFLLKPNPHFPKMDEVVFALIRIRFSLSCVWLLFLAVSFSFLPVSLLVQKPAPSSVSWKTKSMLGSLVSKIV